jgi:hypothetical protein
MASAKEMRINSMSDQSTGPERIWLQYHGDCDPSDDGPVHDEDVTWCRTDIFEHDIEYVRADRYADLQRQLAELQAACAGMQKAMYAVVHRCSYGPDGVVTQLDAGRKDGLILLDDLTTLLSAWLSDNPGQPLLDELDALREVVKVVQELKALLDVVEESDSGTRFKPNYIASCRAMNGPIINDIMARLNETLAKLEDKT